MNTNGNNPEEGDEELPPIRIHETDNYITAIIGGKPPEAETEDIKGFSGFAKLLPSVQNDPVVKEQLLDILKETPDAAAFLLKEIQNPANRAYLKELLAMCWEAALDMTPHLPYFTKVAATSNDAFVLLEVETIIQDMDLSDSIKRRAALEVLVGSLPGRESLPGDIVRDIVAFLESRD
jgi:hypothetical protein